MRDERRKAGDGKGETEEERMSKQVKDEDEIQTWR